MNQAKKQFTAVATVAVALALAVGINAQLNLPTFVVGITNTTTTPAVGTTLQGHIKADCGGPAPATCPATGSSQCSIAIPAPQAPRST